MDKRKVHNLDRAWISLGQRNVYTSIEQKKKATNYKLRQWYGTLAHYWQLIKSILVL